MISVGSNTLTTEALPYSADRQMRKGKKGWMNHSY